MEKNTIVERFEEIVRLHPSRTAIFWGREKISYAKLHRLVEHASTYLSSSVDVHPGERVGILLKNCPEFINALFGALRIGAVAVPINTFLKTPEVQHIIDDCKLKVLITSADFSTITSSLERITICDVTALAAPPLSAIIPPSEKLLSDLAVIIYTSGTTGKPKGAMLTQGNIASNVYSCVQALEETPRDRFTLLLPMFHSFMLTVCIFTPLSMGAGIVLIRSVHPFRAVLREMIFNRATIFIGIPHIFMAMSQAKVPFWVHWVLRLRVAVSGAAPLPRETHEAFERKMRFPLLEGYGLSEASPVVSFNPIHGIRKPGSVGLPISGVEVRIVDDHDHELPAGQVGEIVVRGPNVMRGYYNQPEENALALRNGWLHTGDMGKIDEDGYIFIVDRRKEMLLVRGMNVYPREIEEVLYKFPGVREAAVVAYPHEKRGECPIAFVSPAEDVILHPDAIRKFCRQHLADYKLPHEIRVLPSLPRTPTGKIVKLELKKLLTPTVGKY